MSTVAQHPHQCSCLTLCSNKMAEQNQIFKAGPCITESHFNIGYEALSMGCGGTITLQLIVHMHLLWGEMTRPDLQCESP